MPIKMQGQYFKKKNINSSHPICNKETSKRPLHEPIPFFQHIEKVQLDIEMRFHLL